jgi:hypothetical protein
MTTMAWIGGSAGVFRLHNSDDWCGSIVSLEDTAEIFDVAVADLVALDGKALTIKQVDDKGFVNELDLHKAWGSGAISTTPHAPMIGKAKRSLDELILMKLIRIVFPTASVKPQVPAGRQQADLFVDLKGKQVAVEFFGPSHFIQQFASKIKPPADRKAAIEDQLGCECVIWPYWIQRCESNVRALFDTSAAGKASVWSTKAHFGDFVLPDASDIIIGLSQRFNAVGADGLGYMYLDGRTKNKPVHPIVKRIMVGSEKKERLIPPGSDRPEAFWLPECIVRQTLGKAPGPSRRP